ncbi:MAG: ABC transporter ATP-binding protein, partial [Candidatus Nanohaloarchaea archaeon]
MSAVKVQSISKSYNGKKAVKNVSFSLDQSEILGVIGPNGAGKTTTLKIVSGLIKPDEGDISVFGSDISDIKKYKSRIGYMPEESAVYRNLTLREYLNFFGKIYDVGKEDREERINLYMDKMNLDKQVLDKKTGNLSKGMKRKALLIRSLINDPDLLIYDEPASGLDP